MDCQAAHFPVSRGKRVDPPDTGEETVPFGGLVSCGAAAMATGGRVSAWRVVCCPRAIAASDSFADSQPLGLRTPHEASGGRPTAMQRRRRMNDW